MYVHYMSEPHTSESDIAVTIFFCCSVFFSNYLQAVFISLDSLQLQQWLDKVCTAMNARHCN